MLFVETREGDLQELRSAHFHPSCVQVDADPTALVLQRPELKQPEIR